MNNNNDLAFFSTLVCSVILGVISDGAYAGDSVNAMPRDSFADRRDTHPRYEVAQAQNSKCHRNGVVWSGGVASRFSDRISPRPIRSRWDRDVDKSIRCKSVDAFKQHRVSDQPLVR